MRKEGEKGRERIERDKDREIRYGRDRGGQEEEGAGTSRKGGPGM